MRPVRRPTRWALAGWAVAALAALAAADEPQRPAPAVPKPPLPSPVRRVRVIPLREPITAETLQAVRRRVDRCRKDRAELVVIDMADDRLELSKQFGADVVINPSREDSVKIVKEMTRRGFNFLEAE